MSAADNIYYVLKDRFKNRLVKEHQGIPDRKFRFDWAVPDLKLAFEYEGTFSAKSRHTTLTGYATDCEKYNLAQIHGWLILRYTALNYKQLTDDLDLLECSRGYK